MTDNYFVKTLVPVPNIDWPSVWGDTSPRGITTHRWKPIKELDNIWPTEVHDKFNSIGLRPLMARVFKWHSKSFFPWHIDGYEKGATKCALNWVVQGGGIVQWNDSMTLDGQTNGLATAAADGTYNDAYTCQTESTDTNYLVKTDIPHRVFGIDPRVPRISISMLFDNNWMWPYERVRDKLHEVDLIII
jgi:hypothetical protein